MSAHVLVVEDQPTFAANLQRYLSSLGYQVQVVATARDACAALEATRFDVVCLDVRLPDRDGLEMLAELRGYLPDLRVVVMSGEDDAHNRARAQRLCADAFLCKPFALRGLKTLLEQITGISTSTLGTHKRMGSRPDGPASKTVVMYSHDGFGLGHLRRHINIASRLVNELHDVNVLLLVGCPVGEMFDLPPGVDFVKLPSIVKAATNTWVPSRLRLTPESAGELRARLIQRTVELTEPRVLLVDHLPAGAWNELLPTLRMLRGMADGPKVVLGLRDILDSPAVVRRTWQEQGLYEVVRSYYDAVLVYGREEVFDTARAYGFDRLMPVSVRYCGYVRGELGATSAAQPATREDQPAIVVTAGGGRDAFEMMTLTLDALRCLGPERCPATLMVTGPLMASAERKALLQRVAGLPVELIASTPDLLARMDAAELVVTMAGYNTIMECVALGKRILTIPRRGPSQEQRTRARVLHQLELVRSVDPDDTNPTSLAEAILEALAWQPARPQMIGRNGVHDAAAALCRFGRLDQNQSERLQMGGIPA
ncbi:MAG: response regulator [Gammaproteobacteria bacterium]|nr:response regulator [Gammaproteobacteria bacterium]